MIEKCFLDAYRVLCADKATIIRNFMEKAEPILQENNSKKSDSYELSEEPEKKVKKKSIKPINIEDKNVICEIKSFQKLKIFEKDEDLSRTKKQLEYIKVKVAVNDDEEIKFNETINQKVTQEIERDISSYMAN